ncbi:MAG: substrate-binding domain-containing protein [Oscillospiraceae bacterium]
MKKRLLAALLALLLLTACGGGATSAPVPTPAPTPEATPAPTPEPPGEETPQPFVFTRENFPRMDGSTSMVPLGQAIASVLLGESREQVEDLARFNKTTQSFRNLKDGLCDILIVGEPNAAVFDEMAEAGFAYELETIATDALIFVVNENNPVDNLTTEQIRGIYTGQITNWSQVGGPDAEIVPFQRNEGAGSQALMLKLVMGDTPIMEAPTELVASDMGELMQVVKSYDNSANAIGYSVYYYANDMEMAQGLKIIAVDGVQPSAETIRSGEYPHLNAYYSVIPADAAPDSPNRVLYDWLVSEEGQRLVAMEGYVSIIG